ncbi:hypothetical protein C8T65DRAFT_748564 [Cerioporus squamosus]|nr:hypothetical protein C8T65DRAFT_748564 [Cerioporus squamosus]
MSTAPSPGPSPTTGLLFVYTERGSAIPEDEFEEWYNDEHIPLRMNLRGPSGPLFLACTRWTAADNKSPHHLALYTLSSPGAVLEPPYVALATSRSPHELSVLERLEFLDRRVYKPLPPVVAPGVTEDKHGAFVSVVELTIRDDPAAEAALNEWYDGEHVPMLARVPGGVVSDTDAMPRAAPGKYLAIHEWESLDAFETEEFRAATSTEGRKSVMGPEGAVVGHERRVFKFFRAWSQSDGTE